MADYFLAVCTDAERNSTRNLNVASHIYNYRLTRARRILLRPFGMVCNKWRIFHCAIDVSPDFCDVIKLVAYYTTSFIRETAFSFRVLCMNVSSIVLRLLAIEVILQERI